MTPIRKNEKNVDKLKTDEVIQKIFTKRVKDKLKKEAHKNDTKKLKVR